MRVIDGENDLLLSCAHIPDGIAILRCETRDDTVRLPDDIDGVPVTQLGPYALSERAPDLSKQETFSIRITCGGPEPVHDANAIRSTPVESPQNILLMTADVDVVGIDEAQFFDESIVDVCRRLANNGVRVIVAGLDMDYTGKPFGPMPALMATAEYVTKVHAICVRCGNLAHHSHRLTSDEKQVMLGAQDSYEPICRHCFNKLMNGEKA